MGWRTGGIEKRHDGHLRSAKPPAPGETFSDPGTAVYAGMVEAFGRREGDIAIDVCKEKKLTDMRSSTAESLIG